MALPPGELPTMSGERAKTISVHFIRVVEGANPYRRRLATSSTAIKVYRNDTPVVDFVNYKSRRSPVETLCVSTWRRL